MRVYYWDFKFDFNDSQLKLVPGLVLGGDNVQKLPLIDSTLKPGELSYKGFQKGDSIYINIYNDTNGAAGKAEDYSLQSGLAKFSSSSLFTQGGSTFTFPGAFQDMGGRSAAFNKSIPYWRGLQGYTIAADEGTFYFSVSVSIKQTSTGTERTFSVDPEMIVGGAK